MAEAGPDAVDARLWCFHLGARLNREAEDLETAVRRSSEDYPRRLQRRIGSDLEVVASLVALASRVCKLDPDVTACFNTLDTAVRDGKISKTELALRAEEFREAVRGRSDFSKPPEG